MQKKLDRQESGLISSINQQKYRVIGYKEIGITQDISILHNIAEYGRYKPKIAYRMKGLRNKEYMISTGTNLMSTFIDHFYIRDIFVQRFLIIN